MNGFRFRLYLDGLPSASIIRDPFSNTTVTDYDDGVSVGEPLSDYYDGISVY